jgi:enediyne biosynthesis protein E4
MQAEPAIVSSSRSECGARSASPHVGGCLAKKRLQLYAALLVPFACLVFFAVASSAATELRVGNVFAVPGSAVSVSIRATSDTNIVAAQFDLVIGSTNATAGDAIPGPALTGHEVTSGTPAPDRSRIVIHSPTNATVQNGVWTEVPLTLASNTPYGLISLALTNVVLANYGGDLVTNLTLVSGSLICTSSIPATPAILVHPASLITNVGANVSLNVVVAGPEPLFYQWRFNGTNFAGATHPTLTLSNARPIHSANYSVVVSNSLGAITSQVAVVSVRWQTSFTNRTPGMLISPLSGFGAAAVDYDLDGNNDIFIPQRSSSGLPNLLYRNYGNWQFTSVTNMPLVTTSAMFDGPAWADANNDGNLDLYLTTGGVNVDFLFLNTNGQFAEVAVPGMTDVASAAYEAAWCDYDRDGLVDLFVAGLATPRLYHNLGTNAFALAAGFPGAALEDTSSGVWGDIDGDDHPDLIVSTGGQHIRQLHNDGSGDFSIVSTPAFDNLGACSLSLGDYDNDGDLDLAVMVQFSPDLLFRNDGGTFVRVTNSAISSVTGAEQVLTWADFDNDGRLDLVGNHASTGGGEIFWWNNGAGDFEPITMAGMTDQTLFRVRVLPADFDNDGTVDLLSTSQLGQGAHLFQNCGSGAGWLKVRLVGRSSNRCGFGAKVRMQAVIDGQPVWQMREISPWFGYGVQGPLEAHFGLGDATNIVQVRVEWPSGQVDEFSNVPIRQIITVVEGMTFSPATVGRGDVTVLPAVSNVYVGQLLTLTATPARWYEFVRWSDGSTNNPRAITIGLTNDYSAIFTNTVPMEEWTNALGTVEWEVPVGTPRVFVNGVTTFGGSFSLPGTNSAQFQVELSTSFPNGFIFYTLDGTPPDPGSAYYDGTPLALTSDTVFRVVAYDEAFMVERLGDPVTLNFTPVYSLTASSPGGGAVAIAPSPLTTNLYLSNSVVTLTATPSNGWMFLYWTGDVVSTLNPQPVTLNRPLVVQPIFGTSLTNAITPAGNGSVVRDPDLSLYPYGASVRLSAVPGAGKYFIRWTGAGTGSSNSPINFTVIVPNTNFSALFSSLAGANRSLTVLVTGQGEVTKTPQLAYYTNGVNVTLTATPATNWIFAGWSGDAGGTVNPLNMTMTTNKTVTATFTAGAPSNAAPSVAITNPADGMTVTAPTNVMINGTASDSDGSVSQVQLRAGTNVLATLSNAAFSFNWTNATVGTNVLTAIATDNDGLSTTSAPVRVVVETALPQSPHIVAQPQSQTAAIGAVAMFRVTATGGEPLNFLWVFNDTNVLAAATNNSLRLPHVQPSAAGTYHVVVSNSSGSVTSTVATLRVAAKPVVTAVVPSKARAGASVTIFGTDFNANFNSNSVFFGAAKARILQGTTNSLTVQVPSGAPYAPVSVTTEGLTASSPVPFMMSFSLGGNPQDISFGNADWIETEFSAMSASKPLCLGDFDGDGKLDVAVTDGVFICIYRNTCTNGALSFQAPLTIPCEYQTTALLPADLDGDGRSDLIAVPDNTGVLQLFRNLTTSTSIQFSSPSVLDGLAQPQMLVVTDFDCDGKQDIVLSLDTNVVVVPNCGGSGLLTTNSFGPPEVLSTIDYPLLYADMNADGKIDVLERRGGAGDSLLVYQNLSLLGNYALGAGVDYLTSEPGSEYTFSSAIPGDFNGDGRADLLLPGNELDPPPVLRVMRNASNGVVDAESLYIDGDVALDNDSDPRNWWNSVATGDANGDGELDFVVRDFSGSIQMFRNTYNLLTAFGFIRSEAIQPYSDPSATPPEVADLDGDGKPDLIYLATFDDGSGASTPKLVVSFNLLQAANPPSVMMLSPTNGTQFAFPATVSLSASATDTNGTVLQIEFCAGTKLVGRVTNSVPGTWDSQCTWSNAPAGNHELTSVVLSDNGLTATSTPVSIVVQTALPQIVFTSPTNGATYTSPANVWLSALASDADNSISNVTFYAGTNLIATLTAQPYNFLWSNVTVGSYSLSARVQDVHGPVVTSAPVAITVVAPNVPARFHLAASGAAVNEDAGSVSVTVVNDGTLGGTVNYACADVTATGGSGSSGDYTRLQGSLTFTNGELSKTLWITLRDDLLPEANESFEFQLSNPGGGAALTNPAVATFTLVDNDAGYATNSWLAIAFPSAVPDTSGRLRVTLTPTESGGQWRFPWELGWRNSGTLVTNLEVGNYDVEFRPVSGYAAIPSIRTVAVASGATTELTNDYAYTGPGGVGWLTVNLEPNTVTSNAGWRLAGEAIWRGSGTTATNLVPGSHVIEFAAISGWAAPAKRAVLVYADQGSGVTGNYLLADPLPGGVPLPMALNPFSVINDSLMFNPPPGYAFNGQLQTAHGYGSGVAVRERVVLTAAHVVFDDATLSYVNEANWFFQKHTGDFDPKPQRARGWYVLSSYSAARSNDLASGYYAPGQSSPQSRNWDVAALYFTTPAARGGYGGYLTSDAATNEWLVSSRQKMLTGYPLDGAAYGYAGLSPGKLHATAALNYNFTMQSNRVYTTPGFLSFPGNSGGPVYVQFSNAVANAYFPAGIYLGTLGNNLSVVRAIDSNVVALINLAANLGDEGTNNTGGGVVTIIPSQTSGSSVGYLQVRVGPALALAAGGGWRLAGDVAYSSNPGFTRVITNGSGFAIEFAPATGWDLPASRSVTVPIGQLTVIDANYTVTPPVLMLNGASLGVTGTTGTTYRIEYRTNLACGNWLPLQTNTLNTGFNPLLVWPPTNNLPAAFYRAVWLP